MADTAEDTASLDDSFVRSQKQLLERWAKAAATFQEALAASDVSPRISENTRQMFKLYDTWMESTGRYLDILLSASPAHARRHPIGLGLWAAVVSSSAARQNR